jgi:hypothetical protein
MITLRDLIEARRRLNDDMCNVLAQLEMVSSGTTQSFDAGGGGDDDAAGVSGCNGAEYLKWAARYGPPFAPVSRVSARDDHGRREVIAEARDELKALTGRGSAGRDRPSESVEQFRARVLDDTEGSSPEEVAMSGHRIAPRTLRAWRLNDGRNQETGYAETVKLPPAERRREVKRLLGNGVKQEQIARRLGEWPMTIKRDIQVINSETKKAA